MRALGTVLLTTMAVVLVVMLFRERLLDGVVFQPTRGGGISPASLGVEAEETWIETEDGVRLHAFRLPAQGDPLDLSLLFLHGNAGNASHRLPNAAQLARLGVDVLLLDYRGYGKSEGRPTEAGVHLDARAGLRAIERAGRPPERTVLLGRSLGGAVAVGVATGRPLAGVILESTFSSLTDMVKVTLGFGLGPLVKGRFPADRQIGGLRAPVLFFHGDRDRIVPLELGERLYRRAPEPKAFERIRGAGHNDLVMVGGAAYFERIRQFLRQVAGPRTPAAPKAART